MPNFCRGCGAVGGLGLSESRECGTVQSEVTVQYFLPGVTTHGDWQLEQPQVIKLVQFTVHGTSIRV